jgi:hypothetical protein
MADEPAPMDAVHALRDRGVDNPEDLLAFGTPAQILAACRVYDGRPGARPGLLVSWIRSQRFPEPATPAPTVRKVEELRARFAAYARRFPIGQDAISHRALDDRLRPENADDCAGDMVVVDDGYPVLVLECDACGFENGIPVRGLHILGPAIAAAPDPEPEPQPSTEEAMF